jgi:hypothetical protein
MKQFAIVVVLLIAISALAFPQAKPGGFARELAMGGGNWGYGVAVFNPFIMDDPSLIFINPAYQASYKDYAWLNIGGGALTGLSSNSGSPLYDDGYGKQNAGVAFGLNSQWNLGVVLSYDPSQLSEVMELPSEIVQGRSAQSIPQVQNVWEIVASDHMSNLDIGFGVMYGFSNYEDKYSDTSGSSYDNTTSAHMLGFRAGINANLGGGSSFDAAANLRLDKADDKKTGTPISTAYSGEYSASGTEFEAYARAKFNVSSKFNFVPYGTILSVSASPNEDSRPDGVTTTPGSYNYTNLIYAIGVGGEYRTGQFYFAGGLSFQSMSYKYEITPGSGETESTKQTDTYTAMAIPVVNLGMEWTLTDWLTGRAGYYRWIGSYDDKYEYATYTEENSQTEPNSWVYLGGINNYTDNWAGLVTLGVGMKFGGFALDATVSDQALRRGLGLIGAQDNINTFGYMTASYYFGE